MKKSVLSSILFLGILLNLFTGCKKDGDDDPKPSVQTIKDIEGNVYKTISIGSQVWMAENLKTSKFRDGESIPNAPDNAQWHNYSTAAFCYYNNEASHQNTYGKLYNWYAANDTRLCPAGYRVSTNADWEQLISFIGGGAMAGAKLKESGTSHWLSNPGSTNETGFTALPGGYRQADGVFDLMGNVGQWWTSTEQSGNYSWSKAIFGSESLIYSSAEEKKAGYAVRCIKE